MTHITRWIFVGSQSCVHDTLPWYVKVFVRIYRVCSAPSLEEVVSVRATSFKVFTTWLYATVDSNLVETRQLTRVMVFV